MFKRACLALILLIAPFEDANAACATPASPKESCAENSGALRYKPSEP